MKVLTELELKILEIIQQRIPVCPRPFELIAAELRRAGNEISEDEVVKKIESLYTSGYIRRIGPIFDSAMLGFKSALAAIKVEESRLEEISIIINAFTGVTHNYLRDDPVYNVWFTVTAESEDEIRNIIEFIKRASGSNDYLMLPAEKTYKIKVNFKVK